MMDLYLALNLENGTELICVLGVKDYTIGKVYTITGAEVEERCILNDKGISERIAFKRMVDAEVRSPELFTYFELSVGIKTIEPMVRLIRV